MTTVVSGQQQSDKRIAQPLRKTRFRPAPIYNKKPVNFGAGDCPNRLCGLPVVKPFSKMGVGGEALDKHTQILEPLFQHPVEGIRDVWFSLGRHAHNFKNRSHASQNVGDVARKPLNLIYGVLFLKDRLRPCSLQKRNGLVIAAY